MKLGVPQKMPLYKQVAAMLRQRIKRGDFNENPKLPTVRQLVAELGVSHGVAQRALQYLQGQRVVESRPTIGSHLVSGAECDSTAFLFGFVQPSTDLWSYALYHHLEKTLENRKNLCVMRTSHNDPARERQIIDHLVNNSINGLLLLPVDADTNRAYLSKLIKRVPIVLLDRTLPGLIAPSVVLNYRDLGRQVVRWFAREGCGRILFLNDPVRISSYEELRGGIAEAISAEHLEAGFEQMDLPLIETLQSYQYRGEEEMMERFFQTVTDKLTRGRFDAVFCPQNELVRLLFFMDRRTERLVPRPRLATAVGEAVDARHLRELRSVGVRCWNSKNSRMLSQGMDILQEIVMTRRPIRRQVRLDFLPVE